LFNDGSQLIPSCPPSEIRDDQVEDILLEQVERRFAARHGLHCVPVKLEQQFDCPATRSARRPPPGCDDCSVIRSIGSLLSFPLAPPA